MKKTMGAKGEQGVDVEEIRAWGLMRIVFRGA